MKILVVQSRPYQAFAGGDGAYTNAMVRHLDDKGFEVIGLTSGSTKGRPRPWLRLAYPPPRRGAWHFRSTIRVGRRYFAFGPQVIRDVIAFLRDRRRVDKISPFAVSPDAAEQAWIGRVVRRECPDLVILTFEAAGAVDVIKRHGTPLLALVGFLPIRNYALSEKSAGQVPDQHTTVEFLGAILRADRAGFSSRDDCNFAREKLGVEEPVYVGMGFARQALRTLGQNPVVLFVGNKTEPNREAVEWFYQQVWPSVRGRVPSARFRIVGRVAHYFSSDIAAGIECVGEVVALESEYCDARLVVAPLMTGSPGVKTKVAEAISFGCPLVATSLGVDAGDVHQINQAGYISDDPDSFAKNVVALLKDEMLWQEKQAGTAVVFDQLFSRDAAYCELDRLIAVVRSDAAGKSAI